MRRVFTFLFLTAFFAAQADQTLINAGTSWKYLDNGTDQGTSWRDAAFNDNSWVSGNAQLGYGEGDEATVISYGPSSSNKYITSYFRKSFTITSVAAFTNFNLNVKRDDGVVVYINGVEAWRDNVGSGAVAYNTLAAADAADDGQTFLTTGIPSSFFVNGNNVIAVEVHQFTVGSSDVSFDLSLTGTEATLPVVSRGAYLSLATPNSIYVRWRTDIAADSKLMYGTDPLLLSSTAYNAASVIDHSLQLTGLSPNTKYYYAVATSSATLQYSQAENFFVTPPAVASVKPTRLWVTGDMGFNSVEQNQVRDAYYNYTGSTYTDLWLWLGDNAYNDGTDAEYQTKVFTNHYEKILKQTVVWPSAGNHDLVASNATTQSGPYYDMFNFPTAGEAGGVASGTKAYYSYNYANIHFVVLESTTASFRTNGGAMQTWLQNDLAANTQKWTVIYFHHPPYSMGSHNSDTESQLIEMRTNFNPIIEQYKVDLVLCGHSHNYERTYLIKDHFGLENTFSNANKVNSGGGAPAAPYVKAASSNFNGTVYAVVGVSGVIEGISSGWPHNAMYSYNNTSYGSMVIDIHGDTLDAKFIDNTLPNPLTLDQFRILKQCDQALAFPPLASVCSTTPAFALTGATPAGGVYSGNGVTGGTFNPSSAGVGTHTITYTYTSGFCVNTTSQTITVNALPTASVTPAGPVSVCSGNVLLSANTVTGFTYQWLSGGSPISGATTSSYSVSSVGTYAVVVTNANGCSAVSSNVQVNGGGATITASPSATVCAGSVVTLTAPAGSGVTYQWYRGGVAIAGATTSSIGVGSKGSYYCIVTGGACSGTSNTIAANFINNTAPAITYTPPASFCPGGSLVLTSNTYAGVSFAWQRNGVIISGANAQTLTVTSAATYKVVQTANGCSKESAPVSVTVASPPSSTIAASGPTNLCSGSTVDLSVTSPTSGSIFQWQNNGVAISGATSSSITVNSAGNYSCLVTKSCTVTSNIIAVTVGTFSATITPSGTITMCSGSSTTLTANSGAGYTYQWKLNGVDISGATSSTYNVAQSGDYTVTVNSSCGNATSGATTVNYFATSVSVSPVGPSTICTGENMVFTATNIPGATYQWYRGVTLLPGATSNVHVNNNPGSYTVRVTLGSCPQVTSNASSLSVTANPTPTIASSAGASVCNGSTTTFSTNTFAGVSYQWQRESSNIAGATSQTYTTGVAGNYRVVQTGNGCVRNSPKYKISLVTCRVGENTSDVKDPEIKIYPNPFSQETTVYLPEQLTSDGFTVQLYDILGKKVLDIAPTGPEIKIRKGKLTSGMYLLKVVSANGMKTVRKLIVE